MKPLQSTRIISNADNSKQYIDKIKSLETETMRVDSNVY